MTPIAAWLGILACAASLQEEPRTLAARVAAVSGENVYLDCGREAGVDVGAKVAIHTADRGMLAATVQSITRTSARCTLDGGAVDIPVGTRADVTLGPVKPAAPAPGEPGPRAVPEHTPWTAPPEAWGDDRPLLVPAFSRRPEERPTQWIGRAYAWYLNSTDRLNLHQEYVQERIGAQATVINPVEWGGAFNLRGEYVDLVSRVEDRDSLHDSGTRLYRLSYTYGGLRGQPFRIEAGRFIQYAFPELGTLDGVQASYRLGSWSFGASAGAMPDPALEIDSGSTRQVALMGHRYLGSRDELSLGLAYQKTWESGKPDRDLVVGVVEYVPTPEFFVRGAAFVDFYTSSEVEKSSGAELTEGHLNLQYRFDTAGGVGAFATHIGQPDQRRDHLDPILVSQVLENAVTRFGAYTWVSLSEGLLVDGRLSRWEDQESRTGTTGDIRLALRDFLAPQTELAVTAYQIDGIALSGPGVRVAASRSAPPIPLSLSYDRGFYTLADETSSVQQSFQASLFGALGPKSTLSFTFDRRFGDNQDASIFTLSFEQRM
jgi:hypothetical protein